MSDAGDIRTFDADASVTALPVCDDETPALAVWRAVRALGLPLDVIDLL
jgi:non-canonical (house-cleaning) NTP pyrophosphatase